jgi:hypothetical protein
MPKRSCKSLAKFIFCFHEYGDAGTSLFNARKASFSSAEKSNLPEIRNSCGRKDDRFHIVEDTALVKLATELALDFRY